MRTDDASTARPKTSSAPAIPHIELTRWHAHAVYVVGRSPAAALTPDFPPPGSEGRTHEPHLRPHAVCDSNVPRHKGVNDARPTRGCHEHDGTRPVHSKAAHHPNSN